MFANLERSEHGTKERKMNTNFDRKDPVFFVVSLNNTDPLELVVVKRCQWKCDADSYKREHRIRTGKKLFTISSLDWI